MKKVLIISYLFPPTNAIGAVRIGKLAKYLPEFGWQPLVVTANDKENSSKDLPIEVDESLIERTPSYSYAEKILGILGIRNELNQKTFNITGNGNPLIKFLRVFKFIYNIPIIEKILFEEMGWKKYAKKAGLAGHES